MIDGITADKEITMSPLRLSATVAVAVVGTVLVAAPAVAGGLDGSTDPVDYGWTPERIWASAAAMAGLAGVLVATWALTRWGRSWRRLASAVGLVLGSVAAANGAANILVADGGPGTGNGIVGGYVALVLGVAAVGLGWLGWRRATTAKTG